jgi:hypothetical protein
MEQSQLLEIYKRKQDLIRTVFTVEREMKSKRASLNAKVKEIEEMRDKLVYSDMNETQLSLFGETDAFLIEVNDFLKKFEMGSLK